MMSETDDRTPIASQLQDQIHTHHDAEDGRTTVPATDDSDGGDNNTSGNDVNDSDCISTATTCTALGAEHSDIPGGSSTYGNKDPSPLHDGKSPNSIQNQSSGGRYPRTPNAAYDNPCVTSSDVSDTSSINNDDNVAAQTSIPGAVDLGLHVTSGSNNSSPNKENKSFASSANPSPRKELTQYHHLPDGGGDSSSNPCAGGPVVAEKLTMAADGAVVGGVSTSTSLPASLKNSAVTGTIIGGGGTNGTPFAGSATSSPSHPAAGTGGTSASGTEGEHSRSGSCLSAGVTCGSSGLTSGVQTVCHSRGASTEDSTIDAFTSSTAESRRGTYSEAGTLPIGSLPEGSLGGMIIEEEHPVDKLSEKKLSSSQSFNTRDGDSHSTAKRSKGGIYRKVGSLECCEPIMQRHNPLPADPTVMDKLKYAFTCPPHGKVGVFLTYMILMLLIWGSLYSITGAMAAPGGVLFSLLVVFLCSVSCGKLSEACGLPPLLGMLLVGIALRSVPGIRIIGDSLLPEWSAAIRNIALVVILLRAGLGLDPKALKTLSLVVFRLAFVPCLIETTVVAVVTHFLLGFPWLWGFMLGFILAAVSPAVVVPCLLQLSQQGYGVAKGIPTLVIAAASLDDVLAISGFGVMLGMTFSQGSIAWQFLQGPLEVLMGLSYGGCVGLLCWILPNKRQPSCCMLQFLILFAAGLFALFGSHKIEFGGAGALAVLSMAFVAGIGYRRQGWGDDNPVPQHCNVAWSFLQPMLFALIGTEIQVLSLELDTVGLGIATLCVSLSCRVVTTFFVVLGSGLNIRERLFVALAWLPKATVQAAIGSTALDYARRIGAEEEEIVRAKQVLTIAVLVILVTAPIGAIAIMKSAPRLLVKERSADTTTPETV